MRVFASVTIVVLVFAFEGSAKEMGKMESLLQGQDLEGWVESDSPWVPGEWTREDDRITGKLKAEKNARITQGSPEWTDYEFSVYGMLEEGSNLQVLFRVSKDGEGYYMVDCGYGDHSFGTALSIRERGNIYRLSRNRSVPFERGQEHHLVIRVKGSMLEVYLDGKLANQVMDDRLRSGGVGFNMWHQTTAHFRDPRISHID